MSSGWFPLRAHRVVRLVTIDAERALRILAQDHAMLRSVRRVAREARHRLSAARIDHARSDRMSELRMSLVAFRANRFDISFEQRLLIRLVRLVANRAAAAACFERMDGDGPLHLLADRFVAAQTDLALIVAFDETRLVGGVRRVACHATRFQRLVCARLLGERTDRRMAARAELRRRLRQQRLRLRAGRVVTTRAAGEHSVRLGADQFRISGAVRIVAGDAVERCGREMLMRIRERGVIRIVAIAAERARFLLQQIVVVRSVSEVACVAVAARKRRVYGRSFLQCLQRLVACEAELIAGFLESLLVVRRMRTVALHALPFAYRLVHRRLHELLCNRRVA